MVTNSVVPCSKGPECNWPACPQECTGRPGAPIPHEIRNERLRSAMQEACDLLAERKYGNPARSSGHNARLCLEAALVSSDRGGAKE